MAYRDQYSIRRGKITLYRRDSEGSDKAPSDVWYAAFKIPKIKSVRRSLKTEYQDEAEAIAEDMYQELLHRNKKGLSFSTKRFSAVSNDYIAFFKSQSQHHESLPENQKYKLRKFSASALKNKLPLIEKRLIPFFGDKLISDITKHDIEQYKTQRAMYWVNGEGSSTESITYQRGKKTVTRTKSPREKTVVSHNTINKELTIIRDIFGFAKDKKILSDDEVPTIQNVQKPSGHDKDHASADLTEDELMKLLNAIGKKYKFQSNPKHKLSHKRLGLYIAIMAFTGMRVTEAKKITFRDCRLIKKNGDEFLVIYVSGKGKKRETVPLRDCKILISQMRKYHIKNSEAYGWTFTDEMPVFMNEKGKPIGSFAGSLNTILGEAGLLYTADGRKRSAMSFRPTFITLALSKGEMSDMQLAVNMGTSTDVIERHYNQMQSHHMPEKFQFPTMFDRYFTE